MKILILFLLTMFFSSAIYAYCKKPDCKCFTGKCKNQRTELRKKLGWTPDSEGVFSLENNIHSGKLICFYKIPFTKTKTYFFKMVTYDSECREIFQIGYTDIMKLRAAVMKDEFESNMEISYRPIFESKTNLDEYVEKQWPDSKIIHHKSLKHLK